MRGADGSTCRLLLQDSAPPQCTIRGFLEAGCTPPVHGDELEYWQSECKDFPSLEQDGKPLTDTGCRHLAEHLRDLGCAHRVVCDG